MGRLISRLILTLIFLGLVALGAAYWVDRQMEATGPADAPVVVNVPRGAGLAAIGTQLQEAGAIDSDMLFRIGAKLRGVGRDLKAGEYEIPAGASAAAIIQMMREGRVRVYKITVAEGLTTYEALRIVEQHEALEGVLDGEVGEGELLPETYHFVRGTPRQELVDRMRQAMRDTLAELWEGRSPNLPFQTPEEAVTLASIVEKETGVKAERRLVAAVFINRLERSMRLQSDPTVIYGITNGEGPLGRELTRADLRQDTPYNTYTIDALPPGPIANPGRAAIEAVLQPAESAYLYFVADGTGGHRFAKTLDEHNRNVQRWRQIQQGNGTAN